MFELDFLNSKIARSTFYIIFVGGLFTLFSATLAYFWEEVLLFWFDFPPITFLEAGGIIACGYIIVFGIRFGLKKNADNVADAEMSGANDTNVAERFASPECLKDLTINEKEYLSHVLARCCGIEGHPGNGAEKIKEKTKKAKQNL